MSEIATIRNKASASRIGMLLIGLACVLFAIAPAYSAEPVKIGVLAFRPKPQILAQWQPLAAALKQAMPDRDFVVEALSHSELEKAVEEKQLDFVLTNPGHYVLLTKRIGLSAPLATLAVNEHGRASAVFGGVIFTRAGQTNINTLGDIKGKTVAVTATDSLGGYQMQAHELNLAGIKLPQEIKLIVADMPHDNVIEAVLSGRAEVGFVRSGIVESMVHEGKLDISRIKILNLQKHSELPLLLSTRLYPEWPFAPLPGTDEILARHVAAALFELEDNLPATRAIGIHGFVVPADYLPVVDLLKELRIPPFDAIPAFTLQDVWARYRNGLIGLLAAFAAISLLAFRLVITKRQLQDKEQHLRTIIQTEPECIKIIDAQGRLLQMNSAGLAMIEADSLEQVAGRAVLDVIAPEFRAAYADLHKRVIAGEPMQMQYEVLGLKGGRRWLETHAVPMIENGATVHLGVTRDISEKKSAEEKLQLAASVFSHAREGIVITALDGTIIDVNASFSEITGYSRNEVLGMNQRMFSSGLQAKEFYRHMWQSLIHKGHWYGEVWNRRKNGEVYAEMLAITAVRDAGGIARHYVALFSDITVHKEHEKQLEHVAHYDALTSLPNRVLLADRLHQVMAQALRHGRRLVVAYIDLDGFKAINDNYGHEAGDQLLMGVATRMKKVMRDGDTLARLGGDEFVAAFSDLEDKDATGQMLNRLLGAAAEPVLLNDVMLQVSASVGVTFYPQAEEIDADQLLRQADQAMYQAKLGGKNRYHVFDAEQDRSVRGHHESLERIRHALEAQEFLLYYQPKVNMRTGEVVGAEALIRWQHPEKGLLSPAAFLPVIEDHSLAVEIGEWVINTALTQMETWLAQGVCIPVSVNVGARQLQQLDFVERLREALAAHPGIKPRCLELEVLETSALEDMVRISHVFEACRELGVMFALDDFGTGYSSLTYLKRLPVSMLKIDQSFVRDMLDDPDDMAILEGVLGLATAFRREVIAEGVETVEQGAMLLQLGCDLAQGYGIARPMPADALPAWSINWRPDSSWDEHHAVSRDDLPLLFAGVEHRAWIVAMENHLKGLRDAPPTLAHDKCRFGQWLMAEGTARHGGQAAFRTIELLHLKVHSLAAEMLVLHTRGRTADALVQLGELFGLRDALLEQLKQLARES